MADDFGLAISGPADAAGGVVAYHECVLGYARFERWGEIDAVCDVHPTSPMALLLAADFAQAAAGGMGPAGDEKLAAAAALPLAERERGYLEALQAMARSELGGAYELWRGVVASFPADLFAVKRGQFCCILTGNSAGLLEIAKMARPTGRLGRFHAGLLSFGLEQTGDLHGAEAAARSGLAAEAEASAEGEARDAGAGIATREDGWLVHGLAHALYFQGRSSEAIRMMRERCDGWRREAWHPFLFTHLWWHLALLHAEEGEAEAALDIFDRVLWTGADASDLEVQINALGLLARLHVRGVGELRPRWDSVCDAMQGSPFIHAYPLHNLLRLYALCVTGRPTEPLIDGLAAVAKDASASGANPALLAKVVPLAAALVRLLKPDGDGAADAAREAVWSLRGERLWAEVAGSEEQRGWLLELVSGPVRAGKPVAAADPNGTQPGTYSRGD